MPRDFDIVVIGGGHAGVEAALAAGRMGKKAALVSMDRTKLALMSCNPAVGGIGKSHIVKEIDALGGLMGEAADATGIQFRRLNLSRGPAVWSTRVQADRIAYTQFVSDWIANQSSIEVIEGMAISLVIDAGRVAGLTLDTGERLGTGAIVIATGTFLQGMIHIGDKQIPAGRRGEPAAVGLSKSLSELGFEVRRLKTGTPPRLDGGSIDFSVCTLQPGDQPAPMFSSRSARIVSDQTPCFLTYTTSATQELITANSHLSPIFSGQIQSRGPRYCPSIEDKYHRFPEKERHQIFLEPEGNGTDEIYPSGFSTALPENVQRQAIRTVVGLEHAEITNPGYAIEYDFCPAHQIEPSLQTKLIAGLFFAGQINGTSGYEEAAGQGLLAGVNAALYLDKEPPFILDRSEAYIGVMIDDLCTRSTTEPYRMFTSRAEYRLSLREDNARDRLHRYSIRYGLIDPAENEKFRELQLATAAAGTRLAERRVAVADLGSAGERFEKVERITLAHLVRQPHIDINQAISLVRQLDHGFDFSDEVAERAAILIRYQGYLDKQQREVDKHHRMEEILIPAGFEYQAISGLKAEAKERFGHFRPRTLGQAGRLEGITPGDIAVLSVHLKRAGALG
ncbi:MAG: tRNA uridine-5-carboxymethylaminomethyl(34) synthesis enzyme MnmG [bacterium]